MKDGAKRLEFEVRVPGKYITLAMKTMKNAAYAKIKSVVWNGNSQVAENERIVDELVPISRSRTSARISAASQNAERLRAIAIERERIQGHQCPRQKRECFSQKEKRVMAIVYPVGD